MPKTTKPAKTVKPHPLTLRAIDAHVAFLESTLIPASGDDACCYPSADLCDNGDPLAAADGEPDIALAAAYVDMMVRRSVASAALAYGQALVARRLAFVAYIDAPSGSTEFTLAEREHYRASCVADDAHVHLLIAVATLHVAEGGE